MPNLIRAVLALALSAGVALAGAGTASAGVRCTEHSVWDHSCTAGNPTPPRNADGSPVVLHVKRWNNMTEAERDTETRVRR